VRETVIGTNLFDFIPHVSNAFYLRAFAQGLSSQKTLECSYECSSPDLLRKYRRRIHLLKNRNWFLLTNPLILERPHAKVARSSRRSLFQ
jgi:hypothetical protein